MRAVGVEELDHGDHCFGVVPAGAHWLLERFGPVLLQGLIPKCVSQTDLHVDYQL
jgi:hypothetical protein